MSWITKKYILLALLLIPSLVAALPSLLHPRQVLPPQPCLYTLGHQGDSAQTTQDECKGAAMQLCGQIPSEGWAIKSWTTINSGSCRAMVYHDGNMQVPTMDECMKSLSDIITSCVVQQPGTTDGGGANQSGDPNKLAIDGTKSVYQIGAGAYFDKATQMNVAYTAAMAGQIGAAAHLRRR
ncbi:MAG: hypothetical protein Q9218_006735 [Villophora microphyllina]